MRRSRRLPLILAVVLIVGATSVAGWWAWDRREVGDPARPAPSLATAEIVRQDMSTSVSMSGRLGHGTALPVKGGRPGIITWLPSPGATLKRGQTIYRVDDEQVPIFYGNTPLFRTLDKPDTVGRDVRVVAENLKALGYDVGRRYQAGERVQQKTTPPTSVTVRKGEDVLTPVLIQAIKRWREDTGLPASSSLGIGDVAVLRGPVRVESTTAQVGDTAEVPILTVTSTSKVVTVDVEPTAATGMKKGVAVEVRLPDDKTVSAKVSAVATAVTDDPNGAPKLTVTITPDTPAAVAKLDAAPVEVTFPGEARNDVLAAPVGALVALAEGGYAVQLAGGGLVTVETGLFAGGLVEVSGDGVTEGTRVVTTS
ncbi:peptidoglycan-binding protein [Actinoplanes italicus]|uniref:HlyD family secretion protein n=1 Tax=Actinoplanes italicus TaxID=113567 RepID=A0A2T0JZ60_9ACTN|nr:HlyD family efflux transporter periplasmic adaptor subunit [Actinoplanes italicus]PRX15784.1 HlyD family secretion protein [Actinoplanes italicus]GIE28582.1 peptidoglycan-binding protein [Actinoplanes italicus]